MISYASVYRMGRVRLAGLIKIFGCCLLFAFWVHGRGVASEQFRLLPAPQHVDWKGGKGIRVADLKGIYLGNTVEVRPVMRGALDRLPIMDHVGQGVVVLGLSAQIGQQYGIEGYRLVVSDGRIAITGGGRAGLFYGVQTLLQLIEDASDQHVEIPAVDILDYPDIAYRAVHLDIKYHVDRMSYYYELIDRLASVKINAVVLEFEDKLRYRTVPDVASGNAISIDEFAVLTRYARERFVEISPLVQGLGHASFILKHGRYKYLRDDRKIDWVVDPLHPETYQLHWKMYDEAIAATPGSRYLHVGGDEVYHLGRSELAKESGMTPFELQMNWLNKVCAYVTSKGRIPIFWDDMVFALSGLYGTMCTTEMVDSVWVEEQWAANQHLLDNALGLFPENCIYMRWNYNFPKVRGNVKALEWFKQRGLKVWGAPAAQVMSPGLPREHSVFQPTKDFSEIAVQQQIDGMLQTAWDDSSPHMETYWRGFYDFAYLNWNYANVTHQELHALYRHRFYAPELVDVSFEFQDGLEMLYDFWDTALLNAGTRRVYPYEMDLIELPDDARPGAWSSAYGQKLHVAAQALARYDTVKSTLSVAAKRARRNRYNIEVMTALNELQVYVPRLLMALRAYDLAAEGDRVGLRDDILVLTGSFSVYRDCYERVLGKTRFLANPPGYLLDQNNDPMLANGTNNSDWMHVMELAVNRKIERWLAKESQQP